MQMIDWKIVISKNNQKFPEGCDATNGTCQFPDWESQKQLLPYFKANGTKHLEDYDDVFFSGQELEQLRDSLEVALQQFTPRQFTPQQFIRPSSNRKIAREVLCKTLEMIERARDLNATIAFFGD
jgi:hypothetical protein